MRSLVVEAADRFGAVDAAEWDEVSGQAGAPVFYTARYLRAYERHPLGDVRAFAYLVVRDAARGRAVAVAPFYLQHPLDPLGQLRAAFPLAGTEPGLLSHVWHCYDTRLPAVGPWRAALARLSGPLLEAVRSAAARLGVAWYGFVNVEPDGALAAALDGAGLRAAHIEDRFVADLAGLDDLDGFLATLPPRSRANLRRNLRRATDAGAATTVAAPDAADLGAARALAALTAARHGNPSFYPAERFEGFVRALGPAARVLEVRQGSRLTAVGVCLVDAARFHTWTCGVDYAVDGGYSPYALLYLESVRLALALGAGTLEGGRGNHGFKRRHGLRPRPLHAYLLPA